MNILFIVPDALRADNLHCYGYPNQTSPFIDKLAKEGILFKNTISTSSHTMPGIVSMFTGLGSITHGVNGPKEYEEWNNGKLWRAWQTPFNILKENGYKIAGCDQWMYSQLGYDTEIKDLSNAIEEYKNEKFFMWWAPYHTHLPYNPGDPYDEMFIPEGYKISESTRKRLEVIKTKMILHKPGLLSQFEEDLAKGITRRSTHPITVATLTVEKEDKPAIMALYDGEVRTQDEEIENYIKKLDELHLLDETIIVITSGHGEEIGERGSIGHASCSLAGTLYDESVKVPLIIRYPKALPKGKVIDTQVSLIDIMPTMFEIIGLDIPKETEGQSLMPLIREKTDFREEAYSETRPCGFQLREGDERKIYAIRTPDWKFIYNYDPNNKDNCKYELYDLKNDSGEKRNLFNKKTDIANQFKEKLDKWIKKPSFLLNR